MKKALKRHGSPVAITTDGLRSYGAAMDQLGNREKQEVGRWANNRVENSHLPFRRRERAMLRFRRMSSLQKFASVHANVHNLFQLERHLVDRQTYKERRSAALAEWRLVASYSHTLKDRRASEKAVRIRLTGLESIRNRGDSTTLDMSGTPLPCSAIMANTFRFFLPPR